MENNNEEVKKDALVICSTLNQITNYLLIKHFSPKKIINITLEDNSNKFTKLNIKNNKWDEYLEGTLKEKKIKFDSIENIKLDLGELTDLNEIKNVLKNGNERSKFNIELLNDKSKTVYWNITGGQRIIALAVQQFIQEIGRKNDRMLYVEGNTEKLLIMNKKGLYDLEEYSDDDLDLETALKLVGFKNFDKGNKNLIKEVDDEEYQLFLKLYNMISDKDFRFEYNDEKLNLRDHLIKSNKEEKVEARKSYLKKLFKDLEGKTFNEKLKTVEILTCEDIKFLFKKDSNENYKYIKTSYPAGSIFEKITGYKILEIINRKNYNIVDMRLNYKTRFDPESNQERSEKQIDELDIVLLTGTGQIIVFECKSGGMSGDNAKSHKYTTYRLAGVFGAPIFLSPLFEKEFKEPNSSDKKDILNNCQAAYRSADRAELETWPLDNLENYFNQMMKKFKIEGEIK